MPKIADPTSLPELADKKPKPSDIPSLEIDGDAVLRYNNASDEKKDAETAMNELRPELVEAGLKFLFQKNAGVTSEKDRIKSVNLTHTPEEGDPEVCQLSLSDKTKKLDSKAVTSGLNALKVDPNDCVQFVVEAQFDTSIFYDRDGKWVQSRFDKVNEALLKVAKDLKLMGSPLVCGKVLKAKPEFYLERHTQYTVKQLLQIQDVVACSVSLEPVRKD